MKKLLLLVLCGLFCVVDVMPQKTIGFESLVIEKSGAVNIYWEKTRRTVSPKRWMETTGSSLRLTT